MPRPNIIEEHGLKGTVLNLAERGLSYRQIAEECSRIAKTKISYSAVGRYLDNVEGRKEEIRKQPERIQDVVKFDVDIIKLQYRTTSALVERFQMLDSLPAMFDERMGELEKTLKEGSADKEYLKGWKDAFMSELRRNVQLITLVNRELRENSKFMVEMREKAYEFSLYEEYLYLFMDIFRKVSPEAYEIAEQQIAANPRMIRIVEQQKELRGYNEQ